MSAADILQELKETYLATFPSHLEEMEQNILAMEDGNQYQENFEALYRKVHSLKGSGGTYGFAIITSVCHQMEDYISDNLLNKDNPSSTAFDTIFKYIDILKETLVLLVDNADDFQTIEEQLKSLKGSARQHEINGMFVGPANNMYSHICMHVFQEANAHCTIVEGSLDALQRLMHEHFDFIITSKENIDLNGSALIAAIKLNQRKGNNLKTVMTTSNPDKTACEEIKPDFVILKNKSFDVNLQKTLEDIKKSR